jgi:hypothetical protein
MEVITMDFQEMVRYGLIGLIIAIALVVVPIVIFANRKEKKK